MNPRQVLGVTADADEKEIKTAYRRLAMKYHPDRNKDDPATAETKFKEIKSAYEILTGKKKLDPRQGFNEHGRHGGVDAGFGEGDVRWNADISEMFKQAYGDFYGAQKAPRQTQQLRIVISLEKAFSGFKNTLNTKVRDACQDCGGRGTKVSFELDPNDALKQRMKQTRCTECGGDGWKPETLTEEVSIPPGVHNGQQIAFSDSATGIPCVITVMVAEDKHLQRQGNDLYRAIDVPFHVAVLGGIIIVVTLTGPISVRIKPGILHKPQSIRVRDHGMPIQGLTSESIDNIRGDLYCIPTITIPKTVTEKQKEYLESYAELVRPESED